MLPEQSYFYTIQALIYPTTQKTQLKLVYIHYLAFAPIAIYEGGAQKVGTIIQSTICFLRIDLLNNTSEYLSPSSVIMTDLVYQQHHKLSLLCVPISHFPFDDLSISRFLNSSTLF